MTDYTFKLYSLDQIPGVPAGSISGEHAYNLGGTVTFTDVGTSVTITDDDEYAEDINGQNNSETGANAVLTDTVTVDGATYPAGTQVNALRQIEVTNDTTGETGFAQIIGFGGTHTSPSYLSYPFSVSDGDSLTFIATDNEGDTAYIFDNIQGYAYSEFDGAPAPVETYTFHTFSQSDVGFPPTHPFSGNGNVFVHDSTNPITTIAVSDDDGILEDSISSDEDPEAAPGQTYDPSEILQSVNGDTSISGNDIASFVSYTVTGDDGSSFKAYIIAGHNGASITSIEGNDFTNDSYFAFTQPLIDGVEYTYSELSYVGNVNYADLADQESTPSPDLVGTPPASVVRSSFYMSEAIFLGNLTEADTNEGFPPSVSTAPFLGTFGSSSDPLFQNEVLVTYDDADGDGSIITDNYSATVAFQDEQISYDVGSGTQTALFDSVATVNATVTYTDGSTRSNLKATMYQDDTGNMFLVNSVWGGPASDLNSGSVARIQSIDVTSVENANFGGIGDITALEDFVCFTRGTLIKTNQGERPIEELAAGDMVLTTDNGYQPIRWIGSSKRAAIGDLAPILIRKGALGNDRDLRVSPQHRMLLQSWQAELLFGAHEVLATAKSLLNDHSIVRDEGGEVEYFHILFDTHEIIYAEGCRSESFHPGIQGWKALDQATRDEILAIFPQLADGNLSNYGLVARMSLKHKEGKLLGAYMAGNV